MAADDEDDEVNGDSATGDAGGFLFAVNITVVLIVLTVILVVLAILVLLFK